MCLVELDDVYGFIVFKQKTAYEMRISDWSSDVCSSDLLCLHDREWKRPYLVTKKKRAAVGCQFLDDDGLRRLFADFRKARLHFLRDRKSVVQGKSVSVCVGLGCRRIIKKKIT